VRKVGRKKFKFSRAYQKPIILYCKQLQKIRLMNCYELFCECPKGSIEWKNEWKFKVGFGFSFSYISFHCHRSDELRNLNKNSQKREEVKRRITENYCKHISDKKKHLPNIIWTKGKNPFFSIFHFKCAGSGLKLFFATSSLNISNNVRMRQI
jgi:hypothetical protein